MNGTGTSQYTLIVISLVGFASLIVTSVVTMLTARQNRKWDLEDRRARDEKLLQATTEVKAATVAVAEEVQKSTEAAAHKQELLSAVVELTASDILHHARQPIMDLLIDKFKDPDSMSNQDLTQFIQRLFVIKNDRTQITAQQPAASLMLDRALALAVKRDLQVATMAEGGENRIAGEAMRSEAEPQRGKIDDGEKKGGAHDD